MHLAVLAQQFEQDGDAVSQRQHGSEPAVQVAAAEFGALMLPVVIGRKVEFAYATGYAGPLFDRHEPLVIAQVLADLSVYAQQPGAGIFDLAEHCIQRVFQYFRVVVKRVQRALLPRQFLQQIGFEVGAAGDFKYLEQHPQCGMMVCAPVSVDKAADAKEEIFQAQHGAHSFVEGEVVTDHNHLAGPGLIGGERYRQRRMASIAFRCEFAQAAVHFVDLVLQPRQIAVVVDHLVRQPQAFGTAELLRHDGAHGGLIQIAAPHGAGNLDIFRAVYGDHAVQPAGVAPAFEQQGYDDQRVRRPGSGSCLPLGLLEDQRVQDGFQSLLFGGGRENEFAHLAAIQRARWIDKTCSERIAYRRDRLSAGLRQLVGDEVGIDDAYAVRGEHAGDGALATADAACQSNQIVHGARSCR